jgi:hypothetical protein
MGKNLPILLIERKKWKMNSDIMIDNVEPAYCKTMQMEAELKRDRFAQQRAAWECLKFFENTPAAKADFRRRYAELPADDVTLLKAFYDVRTDDALMSRICLFWNVST